MYDSNVCQKTTDEELCMIKKNKIKVLLVMVERTILGGSESNFGFAKKEIDNR